MLREHETRAFALALVILQIGYAIGALTAPNHFYGFNQLRYGGPLAVVAVISVAWILTLLGRSQLQAGEHAPQLDILLGAMLALGAGTAFFLLRSNTPNPDGVTLTEDMPSAVLNHGALVTHDEMLELLVHSRIFAAAHRFWGWSVELSYQVPDAIAGVVFVIILCALARQCARQGQADFVALALCGGYVQLFFGDVENYTLVTVLILTYLALCWSTLEGRLPLWVPTLALSVAICFHLVAGWLLPSNIYLIAHAWRCRRQLHLPAILAALILPVSGLLIYLHFHGLPIQRLFDSSHVSGMGGHYERYLPPLRARYFGGLVNTIALLLPTIAMLPVLTVLRHLGTDPYSRLLQVASGSTLLMTFLWRAQIGVYEDWNLYAPGMIPVALLIAYRLTVTLGVRRLEGIRRGLLITGYSHSLLWVLSNHFRWEGNP